LVTSARRVPRALSASMTLPEAMPLGVGPEVPGECADGLGNLARRKGCQIVRKLVGYDQPHGLRPSVRLNEGVI
jgi:hypothetical protein